MAIENHQLVDIIRRRQGEQSLSEFAQTLGIQRSYLSEVMNGRRAVGKPLAGMMGYVPVKTMRLTFRKKAVSK